MVVQLFNRTEVSVMGRKKKVADDVRNDMVGGTCCEDGSQNEDEFVASSVPGSDVPKKKRRGPVNRRRGRPRRVENDEVIEA